ncbi:MAG: hypothetical protein NVSMB2_10270 [Chloroflexota bacterium]
MSETLTSSAWLDAVRDIVTAVRQTDVTELEVGNDTFSVRVRREPTQVVLVAVGSGGSGEDIASEDDGRFHRVVAPFTGVFYRSPTPSAGAYVDEGDWVDADAVVGLIETMKIFNEIKVDVAGRIARFTAENGALVHTGDPLALIEPGERATAAPEAAV